MWDSWVEEWLLLITSPYSSEYLEGTGLVDILVGIVFQLGIPAKIADLFDSC